MGHLKLFSSTTVVPCSFYRIIDPHCGSVCSHSGCLCCEGGGEGLINMGPLKLFSSSFLRGLTHTVVPCTHTVVVCDMKGWRGNP